MRKFLLYSTILVAFTMSGAAEAACIQTPTCSSLGYSSGSSCTGGVKCPFGNAWNCTVVDLTNKITELEKQITEIINNGGGSSAPDYSNCKIGDILYSDKSCNANVVASKKPIGVVFDRANRLAIALDTEAKKWSDEHFDVPTLSNYGSPSAATADWQGKNNTRLVLEYCKTNEKSCPAFEYVNSYKTEGTKAGDWYLPALGELKVIFVNTNVLDSVLGKIGGTKLQPYVHWSSSENSSSRAWGMDFDFARFNDTSYAGDTYTKQYGDIRPVLAFQASFLLYRPVFFGALFTV